MTGRRVLAAVLVCEAVVVALDVWRWRKGIHRP